MHPFRNEGSKAWWRDEEAPRRDRQDDPHGYGEGRYGQSGGPARDYGEGRYEGRQRHGGEMQGQGYYGSRAGRQGGGEDWQRSGQRAPWDDDEARRGSGSAQRGAQAGNIRDEWGESRRGGAGDFGGQGEGRFGQQLRGRDRVGPKGYQRSDERIREEICERLAHAPHVDVQEVEVEVESGVVRLSGNVRDRQQKYCIEDIADDVFGVREVHNGIRMGSAGSFGVSGISEGLGDTRRTGSGGAGQGHVSGVSSAGSATGSTASSYGGGMEAGSGGPGAGRDSTGGTTRI